MGIVCSTADGSDGTRNVTAQPLKQPISAPQQIDSSAPALHAATPPKATATTSPVIRLRHLVYGARVIVLAAIVLYLTSTTPSFEDWALAP